MQLIWQCKNSQRYFTTSEQHQEMRVSRQKRDEDDCEHIFRSRNPFNKGKELLKIVNVVIASSKGANLEDAKTVGEKVLDKMESASVKEFVFKRNTTVSNFAKDLQISNAKGTSFQLIHSCCFKDWLPFLQQIKTLT